MTKPTLLTASQIEAQLRSLPGWKSQNKSISRQYSDFPGYLEALEFVYRLGQAAEKADHHPDITMNYKKVTVTFSTHSAGGVTDLDLKGAATAEEIAGQFIKTSIA